MPPAAAAGGQQPPRRSGAAGDRIGNGDDPFLKQVGALMLAESQEAFRSHGFGGHAWAPRMTPNIPGILRDLEKGPSIKARRWQDKPQLIDTGNLRRSLATSQVPIVHGPSGGRRIEIGTVLPYAGKQFDGGPDSIPITPTMKRNLAQLLRTQRGTSRRGQRILAALSRFRAGKGLTVKQRKLLHSVFNKQGHEEAGVRAKFARSSRYDQLGFLFALDSFDFNVTPRPFIGVTPRLAGKIQRLGGDWFRGGPGGSGGRKA